MTTAIVELGVSVVNCTTLDVAETVVAGSRLAFSHDIRSDNNGPHSRGVTTVMATRFLWRDKHNCTSSFGACLAPTLNAVRWTNSRYPRGESGILHAILGMRWNPDMDT